MNTAPASQETLPLPGTRAERFLAAWKEGVMTVGPSLFGCQASTPAQATHWHRLTPKLDVIRRQIPNLRQGDAILAACMASLYNANEGQKLLVKAGAAGFGHLFVFLDAHRRGILAELLANHEEW